MKKLILLLLVFTSALFMANCSSRTSDDPNVVLKSFAEAIAKKDFDGASGLATANSKAALEMVKVGMEMAEKMKSGLPDNDPVAQLNNAEFGKAQINGNTATITVTNKVKKEQPPVDFVLIKEADGWKVDFSMAALTRMGRQQMDQQQKEPGEVLDSLAKNLSPEEIEKAKKAVDSLMRNIDPKQLEELQKQIEKLKQ